MSEKAQRVTVRITDDDIQQGGLGSLNCPIACAMKRQFRAMSAVANLDDFMVYTKDGVLMARPTRTAPKRAPEAEETRDE